MRSVGIILVALASALAFAMYLDSVADETVVVAEPPAVEMAEDGASRVPPAAAPTDAYQPRPAVSTAPSSRPEGAASSISEPTPAAVAPAVPSTQTASAEPAAAPPFVTGADQARTAAPSSLPMEGARSAATAGTASGSNAPTDAAATALGRAAVALQPPPAQPTPPLPPTSAAPPPTSSQPPAAPAAHTTPDMRIARDAFGAVQTAAPLASRAIGFYSRGCLAGAKPLPVDGPAWQAMRLSRNRNWGHPDLIRLVEKLATDARAHDGWPGLLVGDLSQPRGGPMKSGHASHQIGLDADVWFTPMPDRRLTPKEREDLAATDMLGPYKLSVDPSVWSTTQVNLIKRAASYREVERVLVHPAIKKALCEQAGADREWLKKVRPYWGHHYHFHVRIACPAGSALCAGQLPPPNDDGCGKELDDWFHLLSRPEKPAPPNPTPVPSPHPLRVDQLPPECRQVLDGREPLFRRLFRSPAAAKAAAKATARHGALAAQPKPTH